MVSSFLQTPTLGLDYVAEMRAAGLHLDAVLYTALMTGFVRSGDLNRALEVLRLMKTSGEKPTAVTYSSIISAALKAGKLDLGAKLVREMKEAGFKPDRFVVASILDAFGRSAERHRVPARGSLHAVLPA
jgi:pentatricopeptide repeat protein